MNRVMCDDLENARLNRERIARGETNPYYAQQAHAVAQWQLSETPSESVVLGELPYVGRIRRDRLDTD